MIIKQAIASLNVLIGARVLAPVSILKVGKVLSSYGTSKDIALHLKRYACIYLPAHSVIIAQIVDSGLTTVAISGSLGRLIESCWNSSHTVNDADIVLLHAAGLLENAAMPTAKTVKFRRFVGALQKFSKRGPAQDVWKLAQPPLKKFDKQAKKSEGKMLSTIREVAAQVAEAGYPDLALELLEEDIESVSLDDIQQLDQLAQEIEDAGHADLAVIVSSVAEDAEEAEELAVPINPAPDYPPFLDPSDPDYGIMMDQLAEDIETAGYPEIAAEMDQIVSDRAALSTQKPTSIPKGAQIKKGQGGLPLDDWTSFLEHWSSTKGTHILYNLADEFGADSTILSKVKEAIQANEQAEAKLYPLYQELKSLRDGDKDLGEEAPEQPGEPALEQVTPTDTPSTEEEPTEEPPAQEE